MGTQVTVDLRWKEDRNGDKYLVGDIRFPGEITFDMSKGLVALIWPHPEDSGDYPQMVIKEKQHRNNRQRDYRREDRYDDDYED